MDVIWSQECVLKLRVRAFIPGSLDRPILPRQLLILSAIVHTTQLPMVVGDDVQ